MEIYNVITAICFALLNLFAVYVLMNTILKSHERRISFLRGFKKGKCALIYAVCVPLYCMGITYAGSGFFKAFFTGVSKTVGTVVLKYDISSIEALLTENAFYRITVYYCFVLIALNALLFTFSLVNQYIWNFANILKFSISGRKKLILIGNNDANISIYKSASEYAKLLIDTMSDRESEKLYAKKINYCMLSGRDSTVEKACKLIAKRGHTTYTIVINTLNEDRNLHICNQFIGYIEKQPDSIKKQLYSCVKIYVYGDPRYEAIYGDVVSSGYGMIQYLNKYQQIAMDFINRYPLTQFMSDRQIDYNTSLIKSDVEINVFFIGFGKTNQQIFLTSVANNQFLTSEVDREILKPVNYYIFDKEHAENNKNLNHNYYRFKNEMPFEKASDYLPMPDVPAKEIYYNLDINDNEFYCNIRRRVTENKNNVNYVVIAFGTDLENIDLAQKLVEKRREWDVKNLVIFVKVRAKRKEQTLLEDDGCYFIGNEADTVYNIRCITGDAIYKMAMLRNEIYDLEYEITSHQGELLSQEKVNACKADSDEKWYLEKSQLERESSLYCCLSLRSKLQLMGLDYCPEDDKQQGISEDEYLAIYAGDDQPDFDHYDVTANGKKIAYYTLDFKQSRRRTMAIHEHFRWNSFMISKGMIPATKDQILNERVFDEKKKKEKNSNGKNYRLRHHGNLTTFEGLVDFRRMVAERDQCPESEKDVIKYDYQLLDDAYWLLNTCGYKIVKRKI